jgi:trans-2,3-dihydro-3-hydroxyanthranilate isomerase
MRFNYRLMNVFTCGHERLSGNPLCVFEDAEGLTAQQMQALALQFNLSETSFILPSSTATARARYFTPMYELPFAGHPTLGTAYVVRSLHPTGNVITLELTVGVIPVTVDNDRWELQANAPTSKQPVATRAQLARALGIGASDIGDGALWLNAGTEQLIVPLNSESAARRVKISPDAFHDVTHEGGHAAIYVFADSGNDRLFSRFFFSKSNAIAEDPATGSATANLGGWFLAQAARGPLSKTISQGELVGRPSTLALRIDARQQIFVAGAVVELGRGFIDL